MKSNRGLILAGALALLPSIAMAQTKTIEGQTKTVTVTIDAIEQASRILTVVDEKGMHTFVQVPREMSRFSELKVGDKITATYHESLTVRLKKPGEAAIELEQSSVTPNGRSTPGGTAANQKTITATITAIDPNVPSITVKGPNGWLYSAKVEDKQALAKVKVGDNLDITWTEALLVSVEPGK